MSVYARYYVLYHSHRLGQNERTRQQRLDKCKTSAVYWLSSIAGDGILRTEISRTARAFAQPIL